MTQAELIKEMKVSANDKGATMAGMTRAFKSLFDSIKTELEAGNSVTIQGFGTFSVTDRAERKGKNPSTGEDIVIPACKGIKFKASHVLKDSVNNK